MNEKGRNTGRTTRMLNAACERASKNPFTIISVVFATASECQLWKPYIYHLPNICLHTMAYPYIDWNVFSIRGVFPQDVFFDHHAIEQKFRAILYAAHRWDAPSEPEEDYDLKVLAEVKHV